MMLRLFTPLALLALAGASRAQLSFTVLDSDSADGSRALSGAPALNGAGEIAYRASVDGDPVLLRYAGGSISTVAGPADGFGFLGFFPAINASGAVAFGANQGTASGIFRSGPGGGIARVDGPGFDNVDFFPSLNDAGRVVFRGETLGPGFVNGIYAGDGFSAPSAVYDESGPYDGFGSAPRINGAGTVLFNAFRDSDGAQVLLLGDGATAPLEIADTNGELSFVNDLADLNDAGEVAFAASRDDGSEAVYRYSGGVLQTVADSNGIFASFSSLTMNGLGDLAFVSSLDDGRLGLFVGSDLTRPVLASGDLFEGKTLFGFGLSRDGLNDAGQLAFMAFYDDGSTSLILANPSAVPEPASLAILGLGAAALLRRRRR